MMSGVKFTEFAQALAEGFDSFELASLLRTEMSVRLDRIVGGGPFDQVIFNLVSWAERRGLEVELIRAAYRVNPGNDQVRQVYQKYGLAPELELQRAGQALPISALPLTDGGLEKTVKKYIPAVDGELWRRQWSEMEGRVCRVELNDARGSMGTGFLVGPEAVLTNYHVLASVLADPMAAAAVQFRFDYKVLRNGTVSEGVLVGPRETGWLLDKSPPTAAEMASNLDGQLPTNDELDYVLIRLARPLGTEPVGAKASEAGMSRGWVRIPAAAPALTPQMPLLILQHPRRAPLKFLLDTDGVTGLNANGTRVRYLTNTGDGSSGSPCFDMNWSLVALHHYGDPVLKLIGAWNQGVPIGRIRQRIARDATAVSFLGGES